MIFSFSDITQALANLRAQKTRTLLTALGIVFGVGSVIGMLSIGAGAREESLRFIEQLGVRNVLVDTRPTSSREEFQQRRRSAPGLSQRDARILRANIDSLELLSGRRTMHPARVLPKPSHDLPELYGVNPSYSAIHSLRLAEGAFFTQGDDDASANVCVLGEGAKVSLLGYDPAVGKSVKVNDTWLQVVGVLNEQLMAGSTNSGGAMQDVNNIVYIPLNTFEYRFWDTSASMKDDLDGIEIRLRQDADSIEVAKVVTAVLNSTHHLHLRDGSHRRHFSLSRRHRHHEHRARHRDGAHPRNRHPPFHWRPPFRHRAPVPH
jgi:putative ABC transport system permease protein